MTPDSIPELGFHVPFDEAAPAETVAAEVVEEGENENEK